MFETWETWLSVKQWIIPSNISYKSFKAWNLPAKQNSSLMWSQKLIDSVNQLLKLVYILIKFLWSQQEFCLGKF